MQRILVADFNDISEGYTQIEKILWNIEQVDYINGNRSNSIYFNQNLRKSYNSILIINSSTAVLSNVSNLLATNKLEEVIVEHLLKEKELLIDYSKIDKSLIQIKNKYLLAKIKVIRQQLQNYGAIDIKDYVTKTNMQYSENSKDDQVIYITYSDIKEKLEGDSIVISPDTKFTPLAKDYLKSSSIKVIYRN
ncbi:hypothetical protein [Neofamilia massiliensis]|uniref:hypothetical protein n=1 Tax=Neofamilia massiliensis TaxID=1673724 RepID=UPI0006BB694B|nr:hypothetical protein [Neofamilia massiliensis]